MPKPLIHALTILAAGVLLAPASAQAAWQDLQPTPQPIPRTAHVCIADLSGLHVLGGDSGSGYLSDTWYYGTGTGRWHKLASTASPSARAHACGTWDSGMGRLLVFGGREASATGKTLGDTWEFAAGNWNQLSVFVRPPPRVDARLVFDARRRRSILFGGFGTSALLNDTWMFDGTKWNQHQPTNSPPPRRAHAMAYDRTRGTILLFGGRDATGARGDTWLFDGLNWQRIVSPTSPPSRWGHALTYDGSRDRFVMFGGNDGTSHLDDTWEFDGTDWVRRQPTIHPAARTGFEIHYLLSSERVLGFGGQGQNNRYFGDTWSYRTPNPAGFTVFGRGCGGASGTPALVGSPPWMGERYTLTVIGLPPLAPTYLDVGLSNSRWGNLALPLDLHLFGAANCFLLVDPMLVVQIPNSVGQTSVNLTIPRDNRLRGLAMYLQAWALDAKANPLGVVVSDGAAGTIGEK